MIGIYGGTFDPVHFGHLRPALEVYEALQLDEIRLIPCGEPPHREQPEADAHHRLAMVRLAAANQPAFKVDEREIRRHAPSYTVETLREFRAEQGNRALCLIMGFDAFLGLESWSHWDAIPELAHLIVTHRPGWSEQDFEGSPGLRELVRQRRMPVETLRQHPAGGLVFQPVTQLDISSTMIRSLIRRGRDIHYLLPESVIELIKQENLYKKT